MWSGDRRHASDGYSHSSVALLSLREDRAGSSSYSSQLFPNEAQNESYIHSRGLERHPPVIEKLSPPLSHCVFLPISGSVLHRFRGTRGKKKKRKKDVQLERASNFLSFVCLRPPGRRDQLIRHPLPPCPSRSQTPLLQSSTTRTRSSGSEQVWRGGGAEGGGGA